MKLPKFFQVGYLGGSATNLGKPTTNKTRRTRLIEELMNDVQRRQYLKKKHVQLSQVGGLRLGRTRVVLGCALPLIPCVVYAN